MGELRTVREFIENDSVDRPMNLLLAYTLDPGWWVERDECASVMLKWVQL